MNTTLKTALMALSIASTFALSACGKFEKEPVKDIAQMRENARKEKGKGVEGPQERIIEKKQNVLVPREVQQVTIDANVFSIIPDSDIRFIEGQKLSFKIHARISRKGAQAKLAALNLPEGATLTADPKEREAFNLTWQPAIGTVPVRDSSKTLSLTFVATVDKAANEADMKLLKPLAKQMAVTVMVLHPQEAPSDLKVEGLPQTVDADTAIPFSVTVKVPGVTAGMTEEPRLDVTYDGIALSPGNDFQEMNGAQHVVADPARKQAEYVGDSVWRFNRIYNTKGGTVQPQLARNGTEMTNADGTRVRLSFKVISPYRTATPDLVVKLKIRKSATVKTPAAPATPAFPQGPVAPVPHYPQQGAQK